MVSWKCAARFKFSSACTAIGSSSRWMWFNCVNINYQWIGIKFALTCSGSLFLSFSFTLSLKSTNECWHLLLIGQILTHGYRNSIYVEKFKTRKFSYHYFPFVHTIGRIVSLKVRWKKCNLFIEFIWLIFIYTKFEFHLHVHLSIIFVSIYILWLEIQFGISSEWKYVWHSELMSFHAICKKVNSMHINNRPLSISRMTLELEYHLVHFDFEIDLKPVYWLPCTLCNLFSSTYEALSQMLCGLIVLGIDMISTCVFGISWKIFVRWILYRFLSCGRCHMVIATYVVLRTSNDNNRLRRFVRI